jgi:predicted component of type VI protein secretion system
LVGGTPQLIDENQHSYPLRRGRQSVGRHAECHVHVDPNFSNVSRVHMLVEWRGENVLSITDVSSLGTFVDPHAILED